MSSSLTKAVHCIFSCLGLPSRGWFRSINLWVMGPARFRFGTLLYLTPDGTRTHNPWVHCIFCCRGLPSRGWFRSIDLWVMGPASFRCATLLYLTPDGTQTHNPWLRRPVPYPLGHWGQSAASRQPQLH